MKKKEDFLLPRKPREFSETNIYHIILRGNDKTDIFYEDQDRYVFLERVKETKSIRNTIYEKLMREKVGTKVKINKKKIEIPYDSDKDLERILEILGIKVEGV